MQFHAFLGKGIVLKYLMNLQKNALFHLFKYYFLFGTSKFARLIVICVQILITGTADRIPPATGFYWKPCWRYRYFLEPHSALFLKMAVSCIPLYHFPQSFP